MRSRDCGTALVQAARFFRPRENQVPFLRNLSKVFRRKFFAAKAGPSWAPAGKLLAIPAGIGTFIAQLALLAEPRIH
jgi:hypothetical protein